MRVQSINQNYPQCCRKPNTSSFQATGILISKEIQGEKLRSLADTLFKFLDTRQVTSPMTRVSVGEKQVLDHIVINTPLTEREDLDIAAIREFATAHGFAHDIFSSFSKDADSLRAYGQLEADKFARMGQF